jgi:hypothetical protein
MKEDEKVQSQTLSRLLIAGPAESCHGRAFDFKNYCGHDIKTYPTPKYARDSGAISQTRRLPNARTGH